MGSGLEGAKYLSFTRRSYNYLLHILTPGKLKTFSSLSCTLSAGFFLAIPSPVVFCLSAVSQYLSSSAIPCSVLVFYRSSFSTVLTSPCRRILLQPLSNRLKVALGVPSRGHSVQQFIFPAVTQTSLPMLREEIFT
jgi:hypothetical protein